MFIPDFVKKDPYLEPFSQVIVSRLKHAASLEKELTGSLSGLTEFAQGHGYFGLHQQEGQWVFRDWAPNARQIYMIGGFSDWRLQEAFRLQPIGNGNWEIRLPLETLKHGDFYKLFMCWDGGCGDRIPAWANRVVQDPQSIVFNAQVWAPDTPYQWEHPIPGIGKQPPLIYEAHPGMATEEYKVGSWEEFRLKVLPIVEAAGYNTIQLMAVQEHPYYGSFGYHVSSFFAPSSRFGTPEDLKRLIDDAHGRGLRVIMDLVHSHAVKNEVEGLGRYDGTPYQFFHDGPRGDHPAWDSRCFDYGKHEVLHFLLSNCRYWLEEFRFDGFRFDGVTSMLYYDHGLGTHFLDYSQYYNQNQDWDALAYLWLANKLIHEVNPAAVTVAEEMSGMPGLAAPQSLGGFGFDYRLAMGVPDYWVKNIKEKKVEFWHVGDMFYHLSNKRKEEKTIHYCESHDQALVGDKTIIFWLMDKDMYYDMHMAHQNIVVDNGMALHKMIRLFTLATAGNGYLNFMGNEFGHPEWIDFPGVHNNWSYHYARRQWGLADNPELRYRFLGAFDREMIGLAKKSDWLAKGGPAVLYENVSDQLIVFERAGLVFVFNFSPFRSYTDYSLPLAPGNWQVSLNTDADDLGGFGRLDQQLSYPSVELPGTDHAMAKLYIPSLSAFVLNQKGQS